jgi:hypothetical protein
MKLQVGDYVQKKGISTSEMTEKYGKVEEILPEAYSYPVLVSTKSGRRFLFKPEELSIVMRSL